MDSFRCKRGRGEGASIREEGTQIDSSLPQHLPLARSLYEKRRRPSAPSTILPPPSDESDSIDWQILVTFLRNPVKYFYRKRMDVARSEASSDLGEYDVLEPEYLEWGNWCRDAVLKNPETLSSASALVDGFCKYIRRKGSVSNTLIGELQSEQWLKESESLISSLEDLQSRGLELGLPFSCRFLPESDYPHQSDRFIHSTKTGSKIQPVPGEEFCFPAPRVGREHAPQIVGLVGGLRLSSGEPDGEVWTILDFVSAREASSKHNLRTWIAALMIGSMLGLKGPRELRVFRLGPSLTELRRYFFHSEGRSSRSEQNSIFMANSKELLKTLLEVFWAGQRAPISLYPELADRIAELRRKRLNVVAEDECVEREGYFVRLAEKAWDELISPSWNAFNAVQSCYYRKCFLSPPDFTS